MALGRRGTFVAICCVTALWIGAPASAQSVAELVAKAEEAAARGDHLLAVAAYTRALKEDPSLIDARYRRGVSCALLKDPSYLPFALEDFDAVLKANPRHVGSLADRCYVKIESGDLSGALADCNAALKLDPRRAGAYVNRGRIYSRQNDLDAAVADYSTAIRLNPSDHMAYNNRAAARRRQGDQAGARADYERALEIKPDYELARRNLDRLLAEMGQGQAARTGAGAPPARQDMDVTLPPPPPLPEARAGAEPRTTTGPPPMPDAPSAATKPLGSGGPPPLPPPPSSPGSAEPVPPAGAAALVAGRDVPEPTRLKHVAPVYPAAARKAGISGSVGVRLTIGSDGRVTDAVVTRSIPQLDQAALDAVRQWRYAPTVHHGTAVTIEMPVSVAFPPK